MVKTDKAKAKQQGTSKVGVYLEPETISLVRTSKGFVKKYATYPRNGGPNVAVPLKAALDAFGVSPASDRLWAATDFEGGLVRNLRFPKGPTSTLGPAVHLAIKKDVGADLKDLLVDYDIERDLEEDGHAKWSVTAFAEHRDRVEAFAEAFRQAGYRLDGVTLPYFAGLNYVRTHRVQAETERAVFVSIGKQSSLIVLLDDQGIRTSREVHIGSDTFEEAVRAVHQGAVSSEAVWHFLSGEGPLPEPASGANDIPEKLVGPPLRRLLRQIESTITSDPDPIALSGMEIIFAGPLAHCPSILAYIQQKTALQPKPFNPLSRSALGQDVDLPSSSLEGCRYFVATGLCLSDEQRIPNLLLPKSLKEEQRRQRRFSLVVAMATAGGLIGMAIAAFFIANHTRELKAEAQALTAKVATLPPEAEATRLQVMTEDSVALFQDAGEVVKRNLAVALIGELSRLNRDSVKLTEMELSLLLPKPLATLKEGLRDRSLAQTLLLKGRVHAAPETQGTKLADYMVALEESVFFESAKLVLSEKSLFGVEPVLEFNLKVEVSELRSTKPEEEEINGPREG